MPHADVRLALAHRPTNASFFRMLAVCAAVGVLVTLSACSTTNTTDQIASGSPEAVAQPTSSPSEPAVTIGNPACDNIGLKLTSIQPSSSTVSAILISDIPLPGDPSLPSPDCAFKIFNPATGGGYNVWGFYLSDDLTRYDLINSSLAAAGYGAAGIDGTRADENNGYYTVSISPIASSLGERLVEATGSVGDVLFINFNNVTP